MKPEMFSVNVPIPDTIGLPGGKILRSFANVIMLLLLLLSTPLHQRAASRVQHPKSCGSQQSLPPGGKERLHFVGIRPEVQARKGGWYGFALK